MLLLAIACSGTPLSLPDIDSENYREGSAAPSFILLSHDPDTGAKSLTGLLGRIRRGRHWALHPRIAKRREADGRLRLCRQGARDGGGPSASFVQIATGEDVKAYNLDDFSLELNGSWPLLLDDGTVGKSFPSGPTDSVFVIDSAGFIVDWSPGSMSPSDIKSSANAASLGSDTPPRHPVDGGGAVASTASGGRDALREGLQGSRGGPDSRAWGRS